jgi:hypothetical protein
MTTFREGLNAPSPVTRVLILDYYDGAFGGVLQLGEGGPVFKFDCSKEVPNPDGVDERHYDLQPLSSDALDRLERVIGEYIPSTWPTWLPVWTFPTAEIKESVNRKVDDILGCGGPAEWQIATSDTVNFGSLTARRLVRERAVAV